MAIPFVGYVLELLRSYGKSALWVLLLFLFGKAALAFIVCRATKLVDDGDDATETELEQRAKTLGHIIVSIGNIVIYVIILLIVLSMAGVDIAPILAGLGIGGLAFGFGAQSLVKDCVMGIFILAEAQYGVGDQVKIGSFEGKVVKITMRSTVLKDKDGKTCFISNGTINNVINLS